VTAPRTAAVVAAAVLLLAGCGSAGAAGSGGSSSSPAGSSAPPAPSGSITVFAAASLTGSFTTLGQRFEAAHPGTTVRFSFGASSTLAQQILAGAPADVFASAAAKDMTTVTAAGDAADPKTFATNTAEIAVAPGSAAKVTGLASLADPSVKVALCQPQVPCGALAQAVLAAAGVRVTPVTQGLDVKSTLAYVTSGQADAAVVYVTDVRAAGGAVTGVPIDAADNATTAYPIAVTGSTANSALATAFERYVLSGDGRSVLTAAGFGEP
jgi:molybdate transport system substrate-binding protein